MGLVEFALPVDELLEAAIAYATDLAENCSPTSLALIKSQVYGDLELDEAPALTGTLKLMDESFDRPDLAETLAARTAKRPAVFGPLLP